MPPPRLSIVIATYNRAPNLMRTLESLTHQTLDASEWEVIVVNNNSSDDTAERFAQFASSHPALNLRMVEEKNQGLSYARNRGIAESSGAYIAIIDDDEEVNDDFARAYVKFFDSYPDAAAGGGKVTPLYEFETPKWLSPIAERPIAGTIDMGAKVVPFKGERYPAGGNMAVRRTVIDKYGVFNPELGRTGTKLLAGEEKDLFRRLKSAGENIYYVPGARILHIIPPSRLTREYFSRATRMVGISERIRTKSASRHKGVCNYSNYTLRLGSEVAKWGATVVLAAWYLIKFQPSKGGYLFVLRWNITLGLLGFSPRKK